MNNILALFVIVGFFFYIFVFHFTSLLFNIFSNILILSSQKYIMNLWRIDNSNNILLFNVFTVLVFDTFYTTKYIYIHIYNIILCNCEKIEMLVVIIIPLYWYNIISSVNDVSFIVICKKSKTSVRIYETHGNNCIDVNRDCLTID